MLRNHNTSPTRYHLRHSHYEQPFHQSAFTFCSNAPRGDFGREMLDLSMHLPPKAFSMYIQDQHVETLLT